MVVLRGTGGLKLCTLSVVRRLKQSGTITNFLIGYYPITSLTDFIQEIVLPLGTAPLNYVSAKQKVHREYLHSSMKKSKFLSNASGDHIQSSRRTSHLCRWFVYFTLPEQDVVDILGYHLKEKNITEQELIKEH